MQVYNANELYETKDLYLAAVLYATGIPLQSSEWIDGKCYFYFEKPLSCEVVISNYYKHELHMDAKTLLDALQTVKGIIYSKN
jgi:hypothetical protein